MILKIILEWEDMLHISLSNQPNNGIGNEIRQAILKRIGQ